MSSARSLFEQVDSDGNGELSFDEFASWWSRRQLATSGSLDDSVMSLMRQQWTRLDVDGSGTLDREEFEVMLTDLATSEYDKSLGFDAASGVTITSDGEAAVAKFMEAHGLVLRPLRKPPPLATLRGSGGRSFAETTTYNPLSAGGTDADGAWAADV